MAIKLSIFTTMTNPTKRGDNITDALACFRELADEVVVVNGAWSRLNSGDKEILYRWPREFDWLQISRSYQKGYEACTGDWALFADLDFIFHERDFKNIRQQMEEYTDAIGLSFYKYQFILPDRYNLKSRRVIAINKRKYGDRIRFNGGGDLCQPTLDGEDVTPDHPHVPESRIPFYNYEKLLKTKEQVMDDVGRMERAYKRHFGHTQYRTDGTDESAFEKWMKAQEGKFNKPQNHIPLSDHPKFIQETIKGLKPGQFGYDGFGRLGKNSYA